MNDPSATGLVAGPEPVAQPGADSTPDSPAPATMTCIDLDRTVIYSTNALGLTMPDREAPRLLCVEVYQNLPLSYLTERAAVLLAQLAERTTLVPVTTRTAEQFHRVQLPLPAPNKQTRRYAITSNGGQILVDGEPDPAWAAQIARAVGGCASLREIQQHLAEVSSPDFVDAVRTASDLFVYAVVQREKLPIGWVEELTDFGAANGWQVSVQGRKVYLVPKPLTKSAAIAELRQRTGAEVVLAAGDSLLDKEMLEVADLAVRPASGELAATGWTLPHVHKITQPGVLGGERLIEWLMTKVSDVAISLLADRTSR